MREINLEFKIPSLALSGKRKFQFKLGLSLAIAIGAFVAGSIFDHTLLGTLILAYFGLALLWKLSSRISASGALLFLASCPILLALGKDDLAENMAVYAYYLLVITVVGEIMALKGAGVDNSLDSQT